jgi:DNA invertase Pin-like site-specific DNA recombinase
MTVDMMIRRKTKRRIQAPQTVGEAESVLYCRISKEDLNLENQIEEFQTRFPHLAHIPIHKEVVEGDGNRKVLYDLLDVLPRGSTIYTIALDRLSRSLRDLLSIVEVCEEREITLISVRQGDLLKLDRAALVIIGLVAEMEKKNISVRTAAGIARTRKANKDNPDRRDHWGYGLSKYRGTNKKKRTGKKPNPIYTQAIPEIKELHRMGFPFKRIAEMMTKTYRFEFSVPNISRLLSKGHG